MNASEDGVHETWGYSDRVDAQSVQAGRCSPSVLRERCGDWYRAGIEVSALGHGLEVGGRREPEVGAEPVVTGGAAWIGMTSPWQRAPAAHGARAGRDGQRSMARPHPADTPAPCLQRITAPQAQEACLAAILTDRVDRYAEVCVSEASRTTIDSKALAKAMGTDVLLPYTKVTQSKTLAIGSREIEGWGHCWKLRMSA